MAVTQREEAPLIPTHFTLMPNQVRQWYTIRSGTSASDVIVVMDRDNPGVYMDKKGGPMPEAIAKNAGYDIERWKRVASMKADRAAFEAKLKELQTGFEREVIETKGKYALVSLGNAMFQVESDGEPMTDKPMPEPIARILFKDLPGEPEEEPILFAKGGSNGDTPA